MGVNKDSYLILEKLPPEYDSRVKAMEIDERPTEQYNDIGGLDKQIEELVEAVVLPITHKDRFEKIGIKPPKGNFIYLFYSKIKFSCNIFSFRRFDVRSSGNRKNSSGQSMCSPN